MKIFKYFALSLAVAGLTACAPLVTQSPNGGYRPVNAHKVDGFDHVMLHGYDVVAYFTKKNHRKGDAKIASGYKGVTFLFSKPEHKALFDKNPEAYIPQYGGYCANGIVYGIPWGGDADSWRIDEGKLYIFGGSGSKKAFELDVAANRAMADKYWKDEVAGSNAFFQRSKRMVMRVPHYQSGGALAAKVAEKEAKK